MKRIMKSSSLRRLSLQARSTLLFILGAAFSIGVAAHSSGAVFVVNTAQDTPDTNPGDGIAADLNGQTSLRAAIMEANAQPLGAPHFIRFAAAMGGATIVFAQLGAFEDNALTGDLDIKVALTITGLPVPNTVTVNANFGDRVFDVHNANATIENLQIVNGQAPPMEHGGGIRFRGAARTLNLNDDILFSNRADNGGGLYFDGQQATLTRTTVEANGSIFDGGGIFFDNALGANGLMFIIDSTVRFNAAGNMFAGGDGGGINTVNGTTLNVSGSTFLANDAEKRGGAAAIGGTATATFSDSLIQENEAALGGGVRTGGTTTFIRCTVTGNVAIGPPLGAAPGTAGGGIYAFGNLTRLIDTTVQFNLVDSGNPLDMGGGMLVDLISTVEATGCTFDHNTAGAVGMGMGYGAGVGNNGRCTMTNCTVSNNFSYNIGGGIYNFSPAAAGGFLNLSHVTIAQNHAENSGGGFYQDTNIAMNIIGTLVAQNTVYDPAAMMNVPQNFATTGAAMPFNDQGYNMDDDGTCAFTNPTSFIAPAPIGPLTNNGGPTETHALLLGCPAIDRATLCTDLAGAAVAVDQRGVVRPQDGDNNGSFICDIGAYEFAPMCPAPANDNCANAGGILLTPGAYTYDTCGATTDGPAEPCGFTGIQNLDADVWMTYVATCNGTVTFSLTSGYNRRLGVYTNCPFAGGVLIGCSTGIGPMPAVVSFNTVAGQQYIVRTGGVGGATGITTIDIAFQSCLGDIVPTPGGDCMVNVSDLLAVINHWGPCPPPCPPFCLGDVNHDCQVNVLDLLIEINHWGACP